METNAVLARRLLAHGVRAFRQRAGLTVEDVARALECSPSKVSRMETAVSGIRIQDLAALTPVLGLTEPERNDLEALLRRARVREWWQEFADLVPPGSGAFFGLEGGAASIRTHNTSLVPGLLQTADYARALFGSRPDDASDLVRRKVTLRLRRQQLLDRAEPPRLTALFDEAVLRRVIGGPRVMVAQWEHILRRMDESGVVVRVIPADADVHPADGVAFTLFAFADQGLTPVVFAELIGQVTFVSETAAVAPYLSALAGAESVAASVTASRALIVDRIDELRRQRAG
jgi:transcriptional regulator with XRE-family HTH domain